MKILQINKLYYPWVGGVEKVVQQIAEGLNGKDYNPPTASSRSRSERAPDFEIEVLCCQPKGKRSIEEIKGVKVYRASSFGIFWGMPFSFDFFKLFKKLSKEFNIIDFHHSFPLGDLAIFLFRPRAKLILHYHSDIVRQRIFNFLLNPLIFNTLKRAQKIIVSSPNILKNSPYLKNFQKKCEVIPCGVDIKKLQDEVNQEEVEKIKERHGEFVLFVGRLNYYKGLEYLIESMEKLSAKLLIIGEGPQKKNLEFRIKNLGLKNRIYFLPFQKEKELLNYYRACSVFVLPSTFKSEAFGLVLIEAMACGKPVISTELGTGTSFVNRNGVTGFVVPPKNSKALALAIKKILEDKKLAQEFGQNAFERAASEFSLEKMLEKISAVYGSILF